MTDELEPLPLEPPEDDSWEDEEPQDWRWLGTTSASNGSDPGGAPLVATVGAEYGIYGLDAVELADQVSSRIRFERASGLARRLVREAALIKDADLDAIQALTAAELLAKPREPRVQVFGELVSKGHNATVVARWKVGKSTFVDNMAAAAVGATKFLGRFEVATPLRVTLLNYELDEEDMADRLAAMCLSAEAKCRLQVINLRGRRIPLTTPVGRSWMVRRLADHDTDVVVMDPFGAAYASAGGESENDNAEVRRFLIAVDEIKREAACPTLVMPVHSGRGEATEGDEQGRGASVLEDWPDVRILLTKDRNGRRFVRSEGRAWDLQESALGYDDLNRYLSLNPGEVGLNRVRARQTGALDALVDALRDEPGATLSAVRGLLAEAGVTNTTEKDAVVAEAKKQGRVHVHEGKYGARLHYLGEGHLASEPCPEGWRSDRG